MAKNNGNGVAGGPDANTRNLMARNAVLAQSIDMTQSIFRQTFSSAIPGTVVNVPVRNVGLLKRFIVKVDVTFARSASETQTRTAFGPANLFSQIVFTDLSNQTRINTTGWHMHYVATARRQMAYGAAFTNDTPTSIGANYTVISAPSSFTSGTQTIRMFYEIPIAYGDYDLRGSIFMAVVNATANLQLTINPSFGVASTADGTLAVYKSSSTDLPSISSLTIEVYQNYLDQLPYANGGAVLPLIDLSTAYLLNNTVATGISANQDLAVPYANFRNFLSTFAIYDNNGGLTAGTDINYFLLQAANYTNIWKYDPFTAALTQQRNIINDDFPAGMYYFDHRRKPISTIQYGNMQLVMNPNTVTNGQLLVGYEALAIIDQITQAGSLYNT